MMMPKLRFREFNDEWNQIDLRNAFSYFSTNSLSRDQLHFSGSIKNIHYGDIHKKYGSIVDVKNEVSTFIKDLKYNNKYQLCNENDLIFADASEDYNGIGKAIELINIGNLKVVSGLHTILVRDTKNIFSPKFKGYIFNSPQVHNQIRILANGFKVFGISKETINNIRIFVPSKLEQTKIANTLELLDKKIELQTKKIEDLKLYKKGLINFFYSEENLNVVEIRDMGEIITGTTPSKEVKEYWDNGTNVWVTPTDIGYCRDIFDSPFKISNNGLKKARLIPKNSVLVTCIASIGKNAIIKKDGSCNQQINAIVPNKSFNYNYIYYLMEYISGYMRSIAGTSATSIINKDDFSKIKVKVHPYDRQIYIDKTLSGFELKINLEEVKFKSLLQLKKGLMTDLFV